MIKFIIDLLADLKQYYAVCLLFKDRFPRVNLYEVVIFVVADFDHIKIVKLVMSTAKSTIRDYYIDHGFGTTNYSDHGCLFVTIDLHSLAYSARHFRSCGMFACIWVMTHDLHRVDVFQQ